MPSITQSVCKYRRNWRPSTRPRGRRCASPKRYKVIVPGEQVHVDVKQGLAPDGGGWRHLIDKVEGRSRWWGAPLSSMPRVGRAPQLTGKRPDDAKHAGDDELGGDRRQKHAREPGKQHDTGLTKQAHDSPGEVHREPRNQ